MLNQNNHTKPECYIIDDELDAVDRLAILLKKTDLLNCIGKATRPETAIADILLQKPDIVFVDIVMGGMTGFEVIENLREKGFSPSFIFVTAHENYSIHAIKKAAFDYLLKPVDIDELKDTIKRYLAVNSRCNGAGSNLAIDFNILSEREKEIMDHLIDGKTSREIAEMLFLTKNTVDTHRRHILEKTGLRSTTELIGAYLSQYR